LAGDTDPNGSLLRVNLNVADVVEKVTMLAASAEVGKWHECSFLMSETKDSLPPGPVLHHGYQGQALTTSIRRSSSLTNRLRA